MSEQEQIDKLSKELSGNHAKLKGMTDNNAERAIQKIQSDAEKERIAKEIREKFLVESESNIFPYMLEIKELFNIADWHLAEIEKVRLEVAKEIRQEIDFYGKISASYLVDKIIAENSDKENS